MDADTSLEEFRSRNDPMSSVKEVQVTCGQGLGVGTARDDNDNDTLKEGRPTSVRQPGPTDLSERDITPRKKIVQLQCLALMARCATGTTAQDNVRVA